MLTRKTLSSTARCAGIVGRAGEPSVRADTITVQPPLALPVTDASFSRSKWSKSGTLEVSTRSGRADRRRPRPRRIQRIAERRFAAASRLDASNVAA
jgi:hypothetical protein